MDRAELALNVRTGRDRFEAALAQVHESRMTDPELYDAWSVKDLLVHVGWWENRAADLISILVHGETPNAITDSETLDQLNARILKEHHQDSLAQARVYEHDAYLRLLDLVDHTSEDDLFNPQRFAWTESKPLADWVVGNAYGHYDEHLPELLSRVAK